MERKSRNIINTNIGLTIICLFSAVCVMADFIIIDKALDKYIEYRDVSKENNIDNNDDNLDFDEELEKNIYGHVLYDSIGTFIISKTGEVYFDPADNPTNSGVSVELDLSDRNIFTEGSFNVENYQLGPDIEDNDFSGYKINLSNIQAAYLFSFGQSGGEKNIIFVDYEGKIHELVFGSSTGEILTRLFTNVGNFNDIVSVVENSGFGGISAILIDKDGNQYQYTGAEYFNY